MKRNNSRTCERRRDWIRLGKDSSSRARRVSESKNNWCYASSHRHGGVCGVGMLRSVIETSREILIDILSPFRNESCETTHIASCYNSKGVMVGKEVGGVYSSVDVPVMGYGAKRPYLVDVNRERKDM